MSQSKLLSFAVVFGTLFSFAVPSYAARDGRSTQIDHRVRTIMYQKDEVFRFVGHYGFQSTIEFGNDETIQTISMGDSTAWTLQPSGNRLFMKPVTQGATTNMTLLTDKRSYLFELHAREARSINDQDMTFVLRFIYPNDSANDTTVVSQYLDTVPLPNIEENPEKYNINYTMSGPDLIAPIRVFDDGEFTYFQFRNKNAVIPAFYLVDSDGNESIINYRTRGDYIVVERVNDRFTLRHGGDIACVFNEIFPEQLRGAAFPNQDAGVVSGR